MSASNTLPSAASVTTAIRNLDLAIRDAVKNGTIIDKLAASEGDIANLFAIQDQAMRQGDENAKAVLAAFSQRLFLFEFLVIVGKAEGHVITPAIHNQLLARVKAIDREAVEHTEPGRPRIRAKPKPTSIQDGGSITDPGAAQQGQTAPPAIPPPSKSPDADVGHAASPPIPPKPAAPRKKKVKKSVATAPDTPIQVPPNPTPTTAPLVPTAVAAQPASNIAPRNVVFTPIPPISNIAPSDATPADSGTLHPEASGARTIRPSPNPPQPPLPPAPKAVLPRMTPGAPVNVKEPPRGQPGGRSWIACDRCKVAGTPCYEQDNLARGACRACAAKKTSCAIGGHSAKSRVMQEQRAAWVARRMNGIVSDREEDEPPLPPPPEWTGLAAKKKSGGRKGGGQATAKDSSAVRHEGSGEAAKQRSGTAASSLQAKDAEPLAMDVDEPPPPPKPVRPKRNTKRPNSSSKARKKITPEEAEDSDAESSSDSESEPSFRGKGKEPTDISLRISKLSTLLKDISSRVVAVEDMLGKDMLGNLRRDIDRSATNYATVAQFDADCCNRTARISEELEEAKKERQVILAGLAQAKKEREDALKMNAKLKQENRVLLANQQKLADGLRDIREHLGLQGGRQTLRLVCDGAERMVKDLREYPRSQWATKDEAERDGGKSWAHPARQGPTFPAVEPSFGGLSFESRPSPTPAPQHENQSKGVAGMAIPSGTVIPLPQRGKPRRSLSEGPPPPPHSASSPQEKNVAPESNLPATPEDSFSAPPASSSLPPTWTTQAPPSATPPMGNLGTHSSTTLSQDPQCPQQSSLTASVAAPTLNIIPPTPVKSQAVPPSAHPRRETPRVSPGPQAEAVGEEMEGIEGQDEPGAVTMEGVDGQNEGTVVSQGQPTLVGVGEDRRSAPGPRMIPVSACQAGVPKAAPEPEGDQVGNTTATPEDGPSAILRGDDLADANRSNGHSPQDAPTEGTRPPPANNGPPRPTTPPPAMAVYAITGALTALAVPEVGTDNFLAIPSPIGPQIFPSPPPTGHLLPPEPTPSPPPNTGLRRSTRIIEGHIRQPSPSGSKRKLTPGQDGGRSTKRKKTPSGDPSPSGQ